MSLEIRYIDAPEGAQDEMVASGMQGNTFADASLIVSGVPDIPYATLEPGVWKLDGSRNLLPDVPVPGWWSTERSGDDGRFEITPRITLKFPLPYSATGFTFTFSPSTEQWCSEIYVAWYNAQTLLLEGTYHPDQPNWVLNQAVESFDQIQIELLETNKPGHFAKIQRIEIGRVMTFGKGELTNVRLVNEVDPALCVLTADTLNFEVVDRRNRTLIPQENQRIELLKDGKLKAVQYIVSSTRESRNQYKVVCQSAIGLLEDTYLGGIYENVPLEEFVGDVLGNWPFEISTHFAGVTVTGYLPVCTQRVAIQQLAFAIGAIISTQDGEKIRFLPVPGAVTAKFRNSDVFLGGSVKTSPRVAKVEVVSHSYSISDTEEILIQDEEIVGEDVTVTFDSPHHNYSIVGGVIVDSGANWIRIAANGTVTVTGKTYVHNTVTHSRRNPAAVAKEQSNSVLVAEVTLIHGGNVKQALDRLFNVYQLRQMTEQEVVVTDQSAGDYVVSVTPWKSQTRGFISSMESILTQNGHTAVINIQGVEVSLEAVYMYSGEIYSGGMEVVY